MRARAVCLFGLQHINEQTCAQFEQRENLQHVFAVVNDYVIPVLGVLSSSHLPDDLDCVEEVRGRWCSFLNLQIPGQSQAPLRSIR